MLLIDRLSLDFAPGLNVLTGETGAGKSILLDCLGFVLGWRGRAELVRAGASQGEVTAVFDLPPGHPARAVLDEAGIEAEDELILRRVNAADGRKTGWVNDRRVSGEVLRALSDALVELHGQHDDRGLLNPRGHRMLLDAFGALDLSGVRAAWAARRPDTLPALVALGVFLLADFLFQRPPGLYAALVLLMTEWLRRRSPRLRHGAFAGEWLAAGIGMAFVGLASRAVLALLLVPQAPEEVQSAAEGALGRAAGADAPALLLAGWKGYASGLRARVLDVLLGRADGVRATLDALEAKKVLAAEVDAELPPRPTRRR